MNAFLRVFFIASQNEQYSNNPHFVDVLLRKNPNEPSSQCEVLVKEVQSFLYPPKDLVGRCSRICKWKTWENLIKGELKSNHLTELRGYENMSKIVVFINIIFVDVPCGMGLFKWYFFDYILTPSKRKSSLKLNKSTTICLVSIFNFAPPIQVVIISISVYIISIARPT